MTNSSKSPRTDAEANSMVTGALSAGDAAELVCSRLRYLDAASFDFWLETSLSYTDPSMPTIASLYFEASGEIDELNADEEFEDLPLLQKISRSMFLHIVRDLKPFHSLRAQHGFNYAIHAFEAYGLNGGSKPSTPPSLDGDCYEYA